MSTAPECSVFTNYLIFNSFWKTGTRISNLDEILPYCISLDHVLITTFLFPLNQMIQKYWLVYPLLGTRPPKAVFTRPLFVPEKSTRHLALQTGRKW